MVGGRLKDLDIVIEATRSQYRDGRVRLQDVDLNTTTPTAAQTQSAYYTGIALSDYNRRTRSPSHVAWWSEGRRPLGAALHSPDEPSELSQ